MRNYLNEEPIPGYDPCREQLIKLLLFFLTILLTIIGILIGVIL